VRIIIELLYKYFIQNDHIYRVKKILNTHRKEKNYSVKIRQIVTLH